MTVLRRRQRDACLRWSGAAVALLAVVLLLPRTGQAQVGSARYSSIVIDAASGEVLESVNADAFRHPASLTKMMTLYLVFESLRDRRITLDQLVPVSPWAASMEPTKLGLVPGTRITVDQAIQGLVTKSANDAAAALGEMLGGTEERFAQMMTLRARALGMNRSVFRNASGLPDPEQLTTARDMAILGRRLVTDFPGYYRYFSIPSFVWHGRVIHNHDRLLQSYAGADGLKTGYTHASGYNLVSSAVRGGVRLVGVVLGAGSNGERDVHMAALLNQSFERMDVMPERRTVVASRVGLIAVAQAEPVRSTPSRGRASSGWAIQVGSFSSERAARTAAANGRRVADDGEIHIEPSVVKRKSVWRAMVTGLSAADAQAACASLAKRRSACLVLKPDSRQLAGR
jgi:D-alanyl-D-alanine carboxypeptidase